MIWRRKLVRLHLEEPHASLEGIYIGRIAGHYRLLKPSILEAENRTHELDGVVYVPERRVVFMQRLD